MFNCNGGGLLYEVKLFQYSREKLQPKHDGNPTDILFCVLQLGADNTIYKYECNYLVASLKMDRCLFINSENYLSLAQDSQKSLR